MNRTFLLTIAATGLGIAALVAVFTGASRANQSSPNSSGYIWTDSLLPAPQTTFSWIDATDGTLLEDCDDCAYTVPLPFTFNFFGSDYSEVAISTNGFLSFNTADPNGCNFNFNYGPDGDGNGIPHDDSICFEDDWGANPLIASWFDDLNTESCGDIYYESLGTTPNQMFVVEFQDVCHFDCAVCTDGITFETILFEGTNDIKVQYMDSSFAADPAAADNGASATTGLSKDGTTGLQYSWATAAITDGLAVLYTVFAGYGGDVDCDDDVDAVDALRVLRHVAGLDPNLPPGCVFDGDVDCDEDTDAVDALRILRHVAGLPNTLSDDCPPIGPPT